jgi:ubiquinone/menaquinone biosynthesis C-methylase UbiE
MDEYLQERNVANNTASGYDSVYDRLLGYTKRWDKICNIVEKYTNSKQEKLLEIGCGTGAFINQLLTRGYNKLYGCDISDKVLEIAQKKNPGSHLTQANMIHLPYVNNFFDTVFYMGSLHHLEDISLALAEGFRVLKPGGKLIICEGNKDFTSKKPDLFTKIVYKIFYIKNEKYRKKWRMNPHDPENYTEYHDQKSENDFVNSGIAFGSHITTHRFEHFTTKFEGVLFNASPLDRLIYAIFNRIDNIMANRMKTKSTLIIVFCKNE